jgi:5-methylcytosine-specific restriction protein A
MSVERYQKIEFSEVYPKTTGSCRLCGALLQGKRTSWCSKKCFEEAWLQIQIKRGSSKHMRIALKRRDNEICAKCGRDCKLVKRVMDRVGSSVLKYQFKGNLHPYFYVLQAVGFEPFKTTWNADHIREVRHGGTHDLDNLQTLCLPCHKEKTKENGKK